MRATGKSRHQVNVSISIQLEFYYNEYDWGVIYREIGGGDNSKFYKVIETLPTHFLKAAPSARTSIKIFTRFKN